MSNPDGSNPAWDLTATLPALALHFPSILRLRPCRRPLHSKIDDVYTENHRFFIKCDDVFMPFASFGPLHCHLDSPSAPSSPKVPIWDDFWRHLGITLEVILATFGVFVGA